MARHHPLTCKEIKKVLEALGFEPRPRKGGSHEHWVKEEKGQLKKVTVDCPKAPFSQDLIKWMASQAGITKSRLYHIVENLQTN